MRSNLRRNFFLLVGYRWRCLPTINCDVTFIIHVLESAPVLIYRFVVSELPISSLEICTVLKSFHLSFQFTSICLRGSKISRHWPCREDVSVTVDQGRNNALPGTRSEFPYGIAGVAWRREWDSRRSFVECSGNDLGLVWLRMKGRGAVIMRSPGSTNCQIAVLVSSFENYVYVVHPGTERRHPGDSPTTPGSQGLTSFLPPRWIAIAGITIVNRFK